jgi:MFS family permease
MRSATVAPLRALADSCAMAAVIAPVRELAGDRATRRAVVALGAYRLAEFGPWVAILVYAFRRGGATETGLVSFGILVPTALFAPSAGPLIDRFGATRVLGAAYVTQGVAMAATAAALLAGAPSALVYSLATLTAMLLTVTHPAHAVASTALARTTRQLVALNAVTGWVLSVGLVAAPALAGALLAVSSPGAVYAAGAGCLALAAGLVLPLVRLVPPLPDVEGDGFAAAVRRLHEGGRALVQADAPREVVVVLAATFVMVGAFDVIAVALALGPLALGGSGAGYLIAAHGAGAVGGAAASLGLIGRGRLVPVLIAAAAVAGVAFGALALATSLVLAFVVAGVVGVSRSLLEVTGQTLLQRVTSTELLARVFAFKEGLAMAAWGIGSALVPFFGALGGLRAALLLAGAVTPAVIVMRLRPLLLADAAATVATVAVALLRSLPLFRPLPVTALEGVAATTTELSVPAGQVVVREGDVGDRYYAIADGEVEVTRRGMSVARLARGEGFGEIALLRGGVRTATVSALTDARFLVVEREPFLVAVTGHGPTHTRAVEITAERLPSAASANS